MLAILSVGSDQILLDTRAAVLERTGASVTSANLSSAGQLIAKQDFDLIVICHTISDRDAEQFAAAAQRSSPISHILFLGVEPGQRVQAPITSKSLRASSDPATLLQSAISILQHKPAVN